MKAKIDDFKTVVPIALALRKDGMVDRHWDIISEKVGFEVRPTKINEETGEAEIDEEFTL